MTHSSAAMGRCVSVWMGSDRPGRSAIPGVAPRTAACPAHFESGASRRVRTMALSDGQRVTLLKIDDCLAMTHRYEMEVRQLLAPQAVGAAFFVDPASRWAELL